MPIAAHEIQIWSTDLALTPAQENERFLLLSQDERARALQFRFPIHKQRFIAARSWLRTLLGSYLNVTPQSITFSYSAHEKPSLLSPIQAGLQFNLSHSDQTAVFAFTSAHAIGVDIEKVQPQYHSGVAERYFSAQENAALLALTPEERVRGFYRIWSRKEALVKGIGEGLNMPLTSFSVSAHDRVETIEVAPHGKWSLLPLAIHSDYQAAVATQQVVKTLSYWSFDDHTPTCLKTASI